MKVKTIENENGRFRVIEENGIKYLHGMDLIYNAGFSNNDKSLFVEIVKPIDNKHIKRFDISPMEKKVAFVAYDGVIAFLDSVDNSDSKDVMKWFNEYMEPKEVVKIDNQLMIFEGNEVEIFELDGVVYFNPRDVGKCLDIEPTTVRRHIQSMNDKQVKKLTNSTVHSNDIRKLHNNGENFLLESGVYKLIFKSRKPSAEKFQDWVTDEVLPSIRKTGSYSIQKMPETKIEWMKLAVETEEARLIAVEDSVKKQKVIEHQKPKVEFYETVGNSKDLITMGTMAKMLCDDFTDIGSVRLFEYMHIAGYLMYTKENKHTPKQKYINMKLFRSVESTFSRSDSTGLGITTKITPKGQQYFIKHFLKLKSKGVNYKDIVKTHKDKIKAEDDAVIANAIFPL